MSNLAMMMGLSSGAGGTPWLADLSVASYDSVSFSVGSQSIQWLVNIYQTRWYKDVHVGRLNRQDLSIFISLLAWDISSASYDSKDLLIGLQESQCKGMFFND